MDRQYIFRERIEGHRERLGRIYFLYVIREEKNLSATRIDKNLIMDRV